MNFDMYADFERFLAKCDEIGLALCNELIFDVTGEEASTEPFVLRCQLCDVYEEIMRGNVDDDFLHLIFGAPSAA